VLKPASLNTTSFKVPPRSKSKNYNPWLAVDLALVHVNADQEPSLLDGFEFPESSWKLESTSGRDIVAKYEPRALTDANFAGDFSSASKINLFTCSS
jgi:hypothetical protein